MDRGKNRKVNMVEVENVRHGVTILKNRALRLLVVIQSLTSMLLEANDLPEQIEKVKSRESKLKIIKEDIKIIQSLPEPEAKQKLIQAEIDLEDCKQQLSEVRQQLSEVRRQQSEVREKTRKLDGIFLNNEEFRAETLEKELYSAVPCMKEFAATYDHAHLPSREALPPTFSDLDFQIYENDKGLYGMPLGNTITNGTLQLGGSEASDAQYSKNAPPLSHSDGEMGKDPFKTVELRNNCDIMMIPTPKAPNGANGQPSPDDNLVNSSNLMLIGPKKRNLEAEGEGIKKQSRPRLTVESSNLGEENTEERIQRYNEGTPKNKDKTALSEARVQGIAIDDVIPIDQDNGSLLGRKMMRREYSSWNFQHFNEDNDSFPALEQAPQVTEFLRQNIEVLVSGTIKEMQEWRTPKDSGWDQLKKWKAALNLGKTIGVEVKAAADKLENISLACFAYSMIFGEG